MQTRAEVHSDLAENRRQRGQFLHKKIQKSVLPEVPRFFWASVSL
jgi:hypothetical protein